MTPAEKLGRAKPPRKPRNPPVKAKLTWLSELRRHRESHGLSLREVAQACKISIARLHILEKGGDPKLPTARRLATFFGATMDELWVGLR